MPEYQPDWIDKLNAAAKERGHDDRMLVEELLSYLTVTHQGPKFLGFYLARNPVPETK